jgi:hypothetical protein
VAIRREKVFGIRAEALLWRQMPRDRAAARARELGVSKVG